MLSSAKPNTSTPETFKLSRLNGWSMCSPNRRFAVILADANARLGANADCYSFIAVDFHHLLFAGFYRRTDFPYFSMTSIFTRENFVVESKQFISLRLHILLQLTNLSVHSENYIWKKYTTISIRYRYADGARNAHVLDCAAMCSPCSRMVRKGWECAGWESDRRGEYAAH